MNELRACELIDVVLKREEILELICQEQPDKRDLVDALPDSRPTIDRAIRELESHELVQRENGVCKPTYLGRKACELYCEFKDTYETLTEVDIELTSLSLDTEIDNSVLQDSSVFHPPDYAPYEQIEPINDDIEVGEEIVAATPILIPHINQILSRAIEDQVDVDLVLCSEALDVLLKNQPETIIPCIESSDTIYTNDELLQYSLFLVDNEVLYIAFYSQTNHLSAVIRNTNRQAIQWAEDLTMALKEDATLFTA